MIKKHIREKGFEIKVDVKSAVPIYEQIKRGIKLMIISGYLKNGEPLLSIRELAAKLKVNPNTIIKVYYQLEAEGYIESRPGSMYKVKINQNKIKKDRYEFFKNETDDYIAKIVSMGYTPEEAIKEIKKYINKKGGKENDKD